MGIPAKPAFHAEGNDLVGGSVLPIPTQVAEGVRAYLEFLRNMAKRTNHLDQAVKIELNLGASIRDVMFAEESMLAQLNKGFEVKVTLSLLSNLRKILLDKLGSSDEQWMPRDVQAGYMLSAFVMLIQVQASLHLNFEDFEEISAHPMAAPFLASFAQAVGGMTQGRSVEEVLGDNEAIESMRARVEGGDEVGPAGLIELLDASIEIMKVLQGLEADIVFEDLLAVNVFLESDGLGNVGAFPLKTVLQGMLNQAN